jgi:hypothetical protein
LITPLVRRVAVDFVQPVNRSGLDAKAVHAVGRCLPRSMIISASSD